MTKICILKIVVLKKKKGMPWEEQNGTSRKQNHFVGGTRMKRITALNSRERQSQQLLLGCPPAGNQEIEGIRCKVKVILLFPNTFRTNDSCVHASLYIA